MCQRIYSLVCIAAFMTLLALGCVPPGSGAVSTPTGKPTVTGLAAQDVLRQTVQRLEAASSYKVKITLNHQWQFEGAERSWDFTGEAQYAKPDRFRSRLEGPADTIFWVEINGGKVTARDTRGEVPNATTAFGGPGIGTAPYTTVNYLKRFDRADAVATASLDGVDTYRVSFMPNLPAVASLDAGHAQTIPQVQSVKGTAWIDTQSYQVRKAELEIQFIARSGDRQKVVTTLEFFDFDKPVDFN